MKKLLMLLALGLISCGKMPPQPLDNGDIPHETDAYFDEMIKQFKLDADEHKVAYGDFSNVTVIKFEKDESPREVNFRCFYVRDKNILFDNFHKEMFFSENFKYAPKLMQYKIFLHNVGTCSYNLSNVDEPSAIMATFVTYSTGEYFDKQKDEFFIQAAQNQKNWGSQSFPQ